MKCHRGHTFIFSKALLKDFKWAQSSQFLWYIIKCMEANDCSAECRGQICICNATSVGDSADFNVCISDLTSWQNADVLYYTMRWRQIPDLPPWWRSVLCWTHSLVYRRFILTFTSTKKIHLAIYSPLLLRSVQGHAVHRLMITEGLHVDIIRWIIR